MKEYAGRPSLLYYAERMTKDLGGAKIYLKREDLTTQVLIKSTTVLARHFCKENGKDSGFGSQRLVPDSMALRQQLLLHLA